MPSLITIPSFRILVYTVIGICLSRIIDIKFDTSTLSIIAGLNLILLTLNYWIKPKGTYFLYQNLLIAFLLISISSWRANQYNTFHHLSSNIIENTLIETLVFQESSKGKNSYKNLLRIDDGYFSNKKVFIYSKFNLNLKAGDQIKWNKSIRAIKPPLNPDQFDLQTYLNRQDIIGTAYVDSLRENVIKPGIKLIEYPYYWRNRFLASINERLRQDETKGIAASIILGYRGNLSKDLRQKFAESGTLHVLAISGMHIGILAWVLFLFFNRVFPLMHQKKYSIFFILAIIWIYTAMTAFPASAVRASLMISIFLLGRLFMYSQSKYNILFATALIMLIYNPSYLFDVGFQLSCTAILGILFFYSKFNDIFIIENKLLKGAWSLISLGLSAQIGTLGLAIYYFHNFSPWFWLTGIPASLLASLTMISGILFMITDAFGGVLATLSGELLEYSLIMLSKAIDLSYVLQWHHFSGVVWPITTILSYYSTVILMAFYIHEYQLHVLKLALSFFVIGNISLVNFNYYKANQLELCRIEGLKHDVYELHSGNTSFIINPKNIEPNRIDYIMKEHRIRNKIVNYHHLKPDDKIHIHDQLTLTIDSIRTEKNLSFLIRSGPDIGVTLISK